jgi:hypothetical protein
LAIVSLSWKGGEIDYLNFKGPIDYETTTTWCCDKTLPALAPYTAEPMICHKTTPEGLAYKDMRIILRLYILK